MRVNWVFSALLLLTSLSLYGQDETRGKISINGQPYEYMIDECGDTLIMASLGDVAISSMRLFDNPEDLKTYRRYRRYAYHVYPYAAEAIKIFREVEYATNNMKKRKRKKYIRKLQKDLKKEFNDPLRKLTKTQGKVLFKMIEKELDTSMFHLLKDLKGGFNASYWGTIGRLYGHRLKDKYQRGDDPILDIVLDDIDISYEVPDREGFVDEDEDDGK